MVLLRLMRSLCCATRVFSTTTRGSFTPKEFKRYPITQVTTVSPDTKVFRMALESPTASTGMTVSSLVMVKGLNDDARPYTPITLNENVGYFDLLVKAYPHGTVSSYVHSLKVGDELSVQGPFAKLPYQKNMKRNLCFLAGGTGITPCLQVINEVIRLKEEGDTSQLRLLFANRKEEDILLRNILEDLDRNNDNFSVEYILSQPSEQWKGMTGRVNSNCLEKFLPGPSSDMLVYVCGPPGFMEGISGNKLPTKEQGPVGGLLKSLGYTENMVYKF